MDMLLVYGTIVNVVSIALLLFILLCIYKAVTQRSKTWGIMTFIAVLVFSNIVGNVGTYGPKSTVHGSINIDTPMSIEIPNIKVDVVEIEEQEHIKEKEVEEAGKDLKAFFNN